MKRTVLASFENADGTLCVDVFERVDGSFGFELFRGEFDGASRLQSLHSYAHLSFASGELALQKAKVCVSWLSRDETWRW